MFFKVIGKLKSDKRGFTLPEVMVTMAIMAIATLLVTNLIRTIIRNYRQVEYQWMVQTFVKYVAETFESNADREALSTADEAYMYYNDMGDPPSGNVHTTSFTLASCPELGQITYNNEDFTISFTPPNTAENLKTLQKCFRYFITFDKHFFVIDYHDYLNITTSTDGSGNTTYNYSIKSGPITIAAKNGELLFGAYEDTDYQLDIKFSYAVSTMNPEKEKLTKEEGLMLELPTDSDYQNRRFLHNGITAEIRGVIRNTVDTGLAANTTFVSSYELLNLLSNKGVNYAPSGTALSPYAAGWTDRGVEQGKRVAVDAEGNRVLESFTESDSDYQARLVARNSSFGNYVNSDTVVNPTQTANVIKYHSVNTDEVLKDALGEQTVPNISVSMPICLFTSLTIGSDRQVQILEPLRDFRDTVLRGNAVGEWIIDKYYAWSPTVIGWTENSKMLKNTLKVVTEGLALFATVAVE
ncbi:MAG: prepilin-type N-terminal cleavage/methylation domain-containing protein [Ruminococcaceae bacterium]|jgi:prepilin-type N-terminal cleavage/methylation domain-containing protein|nr:prepilin-type N-terminal cleavage/methylation domain-containing protein [Oscillospiraceae bacterium]